jgi:uncharacterized protein DUF4203
MLPSSYELPAAILLTAGGLIACFAGYRLFRLVLAMYGFILGAMIGSSMMGITSTFGMIAAALIGGAIGALILVFAYFIGIALVGAGLGALVTHVVWGLFSSADPPALLIIAASIAAAIGAMMLQRYVIVVGTAFGGAWTAIVGALTLVEGRVVRAAAREDVWILYPFSPGGESNWTLIVWVVLGLIGMTVQLAVTGRKKE